MSTEVHEASHCAMALWLKRPVDHVWRNTGGALPGETIGHCRAPIGDRIEPSQLLIALAGYWGIDPEWPPIWPACLDETREALGLVLDILGADEERYEATVALCHRIMADETWLALRDSIARALLRAPRLEADDLEELCRIHSIPSPYNPQQEQPCNT